MSEIWLNGHYTMGKKFNGKLDGFGRLIRGGRELIDNVKHIQGAYQEADHFANLGTDGQGEITGEGVKITEDWKAVRGYWMVAKRDEGWSGCGVVIKAVETTNWISISKIAAPLKVCTAMAAEIAGAGMLTGVVFSLEKKEFNLQNINSCIDEILKETKTKDS